MAGMAIGAATDGGGVESLNPSSWVLCGHLRKAFRREHKGQRLGSFGGGGGCAPNRRGPLRPLAEVATVARFWKKEFREGDERVLKKMRKMKLDPGVQRRTRLLHSTHTDPSQLDPADKGEPGS
ncbi:hypothetical protein V6N13_056938 [Hibiscus sabdariffa]